MVTIRNIGWNKCLTPVFYHQVYQLLFLASSNFKIFILCTWSSNVCQIAVTRKRYHSLYSKIACLLFSPIYRTNISRQNIRTLCAVNGTRCDEFWMETRPLYSQAPGSCWLFHSGCLHNRTTGKCTKSVPLSVSGLIAVSTIPNRDSSGGYQRSFLFSPHFLPTLCLCVHESDNACDCTGRQSSTFTVSCGLSCPRPSGSMNGWTIKTKSVTAIFYKILRQQKRECYSLTALGGWRKSKGSIFRWNLDESMYPVWDLVKTRTTVWGLKVSGNTYELFPWQSCNSTKFSLDIGKINCTDYKIPWLLTCRISFETLRNNIVGNATAFHLDRRASPLFWTDYLQKQPLMVQWNRCLRPLSSTGKK